MVIHSNIKMYFNSNQKTCIKLYQKKVKHLTDLQDYLEKKDRSTPWVFIILDLSLELDALCTIGL